MANHRMYWILAEAENGYVDFYANDIPAQRLGPMAARRTPINEYLRPGRNVGAFRIARDADPARLPKEGATAKLSVTLDEMVFDDAGEEVSSRPLVQQEVDVRMTPGDPTPLLTFQFDAHPPGGLPPLSDFTPLGPAELHAVSLQLQTAARWWQEGRADEIVAWLDPYILDFVASYPTESVEGYRTAFRRMVKTYSPPGAQLDFEPRALDFDLCAGGRLAECLTRHRDGAGIRLVREPTNYYDFNLIVGVRNGRVVPVR